MIDGLTVQYKRIRSGQPRPYADSYYDGDLTLTGPSKFLPGEAAVLKLAKVLIHDFTHDARTDTEIPWYAPRLVRVTSGMVTHDADADTYQQVWSINIMRPYLD